MWHLLLPAPATSMFCSLLLCQLVSAMAAGVQFSAHLNTSNFMMKGNRVPLISKQNVPQEPMGNLLKLMMQFGPTCSLEQS